MGIVSAKSRAIGAGPYDDFVQTDASINPGNSGGPLFNLRGEVIGINTAINPQGQGIGFAIPIDALKDVLPQLLSTGHVARGRLGVGIQGVDDPLAKALGLDRPKGALVGEVERSGPGERAGLRSGDVILAVDDADVPTAHDLPRMIARHAPGSKVTLKVVREKTTRNVDATLDALKEDDEGGSGGAVGRGGGTGGSSTPSVKPQSLGVEIEDAGSGGALVRRVVPGGPADGQLVPGDVITEVNRQRAASAVDVQRLVKSGGGAVMLKVERNGRSRFVGVTAAP